MSVGVVGLIKEYIEGCGKATQVAVVTNAGEVKFALPGNIKQKEEQFGEVWGALNTVLSRLIVPERFGDVQRIFSATLSNQVKELIDGQKQSPLFRRASGKGG